MECFGHVVVVAQYIHIIIDIRDTISGSISHNRSPIPRLLKPSMQLRPQAMKSWIQKIYGRVVTSALLGINDWEDPTGCEIQKRRDIFYEN